VTANQDSFPSLTIIAFYHEAHVWLKLLYRCHSLAVTTQRSILAIKFRGVKRVRLGLLPTPCNQVIRMTPEHLRHTFRRSQRLGARDRDQIIVTFQ